MTLAYLTALQQAILLVQLNIAIHGIYGYRITISGNAQNTLCARSTNGIRIQLPITRNADDVDIVPIDPVFCQELIEAIGITRLQENQCLASSFDSLIRYFDRLLPQKS